VHRVSGGDGSRHEPGEYHSGELHRGCAEAEAERIIAEELERHGWREADLLTRRSSDPVKLEMAARLRRVTTLSLKAIAKPVQLGSSVICWT
jgi:hypothetical protein